MEDHADAVRCREPQAYSEAERMKEWQDAQDFILATQHEDLRNLADVGEYVVMGEHHAFGIAGAATGKNHRSQIVRGLPPGADGKLEQPVGQRPGKEQRNKLL